MTAAVRDSFKDLERHRLRLEENVEKLRKSLQHWRVWDAEYEGFKEEILGLKSQPTNAELAAVAADFNGSLLNQKETQDVTGAKSGSRRSSRQIADLLDKRIDYVTQNIRILQKQLETAEEKLASVRVLRQPDVRTEEGLPLTEILEELDDDGNVLSGKTSRPGDVAPQVLEVLSKIENSDKNADETTVGQENGPDQVQVHDPRPREEHSVKQTSTSTRKGSSEATKGTKRGVSFAEGTKSAEDLSSRPKKESTHQKRPFYARPNSRFTGIFSSEEEDKSPPVIPANETPEDAALRKQIIDYSLSEVGSVVAELTLDEDSDLESDEDLDDEDLSAGSANEEDQWGRTTRRVVGDDYKKQMAELEQRLNAQMMVNAGPNGEHHDVEFQPQYSGSIVKKDGADGSKNQNLAQNGGMGFVKKPVKGKGVRWAGKPEIAPDSDPDGIRSTTLEDIVRETDLRESNISETSATKKQSRFKSSRLAAGPKPPNKDDTSQFRILAESQKPVSSTIIERAPVIQSNLSPGEGNGGVKMLVDDDSLSHEQEGPPTKTVLDEIVERPSSGLPTVPQTSDELDPDFLQQEVQTEYYRIRNRMIFKQGGFLEEDSEEMPIPEEEGGPPKMSKFKAARVKL